MIDLSTVAANKIAVNCKTKEEAERFLSHVWDTMPNACRCWEAPIETQWEVYRVETSHSLFEEYGDPGPTLYYSSVCDYKWDGYTIVDFSDVLLDTPDLGDLDATEVNLSSLFSGEVPVDA